MCLDAYFYEECEAFLEEDAPYASAPVCQDLMVLVAWPAPRRVNNVLITWTDSRRLAQARAPPLPALTREKTRPARGMGALLAFCAYGLQSL